MRLVDANAIEKDWYTELHSNYKDDYAKGFQAGLMTAVRYPTIEAEPVVHGEWILDEYGNPHCSVCEHVQDAQTNYCSECGTKMDGGNQNE